LYETYERILQNITDDDIWFAQKALSWLVTSDRPLRLSEIVEAMAVDVQSRSLDRDATLNDEQDLLEICSSLVDYNESTTVVGLSHHSVKVCRSWVAASLIIDRECFSFQEFFLSSHLESTPLAGFKTSLFEGHRDLSKICLTYILLDSFEEGPCETVSAYDDRKTQFPFLDYAAHCWSMHAEECPGADDVFQLLMDLICCPTFRQHYWSFVQARHGSALGFHADKDPLSWLTNCRLTWVLKCLLNSTSPHSWFNDELGAHGTPLINAAFRDDVEMIDFLIDIGVDINKPCDKHLLVAGVFPLFVAAAHGYQRAFDLLLNRGANPRQWHTFTHDTALHDVCGQGRMYMVKELISRGAEVDSRNREGKTPLHVAVQGGWLEVVRFLVETAGAQTLTGRCSNFGSGSAKTAVHYAIELQSAAITEYLVERCGDDLTCLENLSLEQIKWAEGEPWYAKLRDVIMAGLPGSSRVNGGLGEVVSLTAEDVIHVRTILERRFGLSRKLVGRILEEAEYWIRMVARREELVVANQNTPDHPYVWVRIPGRGETFPVRKVVFRTRSHDQGGSPPSSL
jgi:hypothetical protein